MWASSMIRSAFQSLGLYPLNKAFVVFRSRWSVASVPDRWHMLQTIDDQEQRGKTEGV